jgi:hypothetical protein
MEEEAAQADAGAFPVPPMDLPHYHGLPGLPDALAQDAGSQGDTGGRPPGSSGVKEVTGA